MHSYRIPYFIRRICLGILLFTISFVYTAHSKEVVSSANVSEVPIPKQHTQIPLYHNVEALPNPIGKITDMYLLDTKVDALFLPLSKIKYSFLSGGMWLRLPLEGKPIAGQYLFLNLGSFVSFPISVYRSVSLDSRVSFEKLGTYETSRINLQTADAKPEATYTYYISIPTIPSPLFSPILENGNSSIADTVSIIQMLCFGIIIIAIIFSFLRAILQRKPLFLLLPFFSSCILISLVFGVPNTSPGFIRLDSLPTMLSAIFAVVLFPLFSLFALVRNGDIIPKTQKNIAVIITLLVFCVIIIPLIPTMAFFSRYFPFWPLLLLFSFPISFYALQKGYTNSFLYFIACIAPTIALGITTIAVFLYVDAFFYVETLPVIGLTISVCAITLFRIPFTFMHDKREASTRSLRNQTEITPYWMNTLTGIDEEQEGKEPINDYSSSLEEEIEEEYDIPTMVKERVVQAMNREPNIIPYSPRELFVYLYRALKKYSENYNVELSWFVDPDLDENQEHDSDVIYNTLYSIGESLIINNPNSSVHISAKKITDVSLPSHIRFSITITPENTLHNFNSNSIADIAELIALAGGTLFMGNAQGKKMEMIITLPAVAKLISIATTPKEQSLEYKPIDKQAEEIKKVIDSELEEYDATHQENPLLHDLEQAVEATLQSEETYPTDVEESFSTIEQEEKTEEEHDIQVTQDKESTLPQLEEEYSEEEEQQALADLRSELERLTEQEEESDKSKDILIESTSDVITLVGEGNILDEVEDVTSHTIMKAPLAPPITKMPLPKIDNHGNEILHATTPLPSSNEGVLSSTIHDIVNEYLDTLDAQVEDVIESMHENEITDITEVDEQIENPHDFFSDIDKNISIDNSETEQYAENTLLQEDTLTQLNQEEPLATVEGISTPPSSLDTIADTILSEQGNETTNTVHREEYIPPALEDNSYQEIEGLASNEQGESNLHQHTTEDTSIDISQFIDDTVYATSPSETVPLLLTNDMLVHEESDTNTISAQTQSVPLHDMPTSTSFTTSIRSSVQELLDAHIEAEWEEIRPIFSDRSSVIIMDSDANNRKLLLYFLEGLDYAIADVDTAQSLLKQHAHYPAHLVVVDVNSLDIPITELIADLHKIDARYKEPPVMVVAIIDSHSTQLNITNSGVVAVLTKPVNHSEFRGLLLKLLPERAFNTGRTAPQWAIEDDIAPMDFNKVTIQPLTIEEQPSQRTPSYSSVATVTVQTSATKKDSLLSASNESRIKESTRTDNRLYTPSATVTEKKTIDAIYKEIDDIQDYLYPAIPHLLSIFREDMMNAQRALHARDYYKVGDSVNRIAMESRRFSLHSIEKIASCVERASTESDESAVNILFEELFTIIELAYPLLKELYERYTA